MVNRQDSISQSILVMNWLQINLSLSYGMIRHDSAVPEMV